MDGIVDSREVLKRVVAEAPQGHSEIRESARSAAAQTRIGRSLFMREFGVASELEYKQQSMRDGRIMYHAHVGMNDMAATAAALRAIHTELASTGHRLDRAGFAVDRRMGLPVEMREQAAAETGPMLVDDNDWDALAESAPIQPHLGDFMIGQPSSLQNTVQALRIGCTTVGNLSQFFTFEAPGWSDTADTARQTCSAIALLAEFREQGCMLHSYLEDGYGALFRHCASVAAWAMLERYLVEELLGARLSHCIGGLTTDPVRRAGWVIALQQIHGGDHVGSMIYGDTLSFGRDFEKNRALTAEYLQWDILAQMHCPSGHGVLPLPVTEAIRIPSAEEIIEAQRFGRRVEEGARRLYPHVDFSAAQAFADEVCRDARPIFDAALAGFGEAGVDTRNPLQMLYVMKRLGADHFERLFADLPDTASLTDMYALSQGVVESHRYLLDDENFLRQVKGRRFLVASSDVHEHAAGALAQLLSEAGASVIYLGAEQNPDDLTTALEQHSADAILLSTHNGMALEYARQLRDLLDAGSQDVPVVMGGVLNQKVEDRDLPVPVVEELKGLGMLPVMSLPGLPRLLESNLKR